MSYELNFYTLALFINIWDGYHKGRGSLIVSVDSLYLIFALCAHKDLEILNILSPSVLLSLHHRWWLYMCISVNFGRILFGALSGGNVRTWLFLSVHFQMQVEETQLQVAWREFTGSCNWRTTSGLAGSKCSYSVTGKPSLSTSYLCFPLLVSFSGRWWALATLIA